MCLRDAYAKAVAVLYATGAKQKTLLPALNCAASWGAAGQLEGRPHEASATNNQTKHASVQGNAGAQLLVHLTQ
jgi:hypothetical protein